MSITKLFQILKSQYFWLKLFFPFAGLASLVWFLIRVIPKPSRAAYPCMRVAAPLASSFVVYILGLLGSITAFKLVKVSFNRAKYVSGTLAMIALLGISTWFVIDSASPAKAKFVDQFPANQPIGEAKGIFPGRVVWSWNPEATNENCENTVNEDGIIDNNDDIYYLAKNNNESVIKDMVSEVLQKLTGTENDAAAWDSVFHYFNRETRKIIAGYSSEEKIFIKTNNQGVGLPHNMNSDLSQRDGPIWDPYPFPPHITATSPYAILAVLDQLVNQAGVPQNMIFVGDPHININKIYYDILSTDFPYVHYMGVNSDSVTDCESYGRTLSVPTEQEVVFYSDKGTVLDQTSDKLYQQMYDATYMINLAALKSHIRAGITLFAKSHFGSHTELSAEHLHPGLVNPLGQTSGTNFGYGKYRVLVDLMGHEHLGGKTMLFILDGLWGGPPHELYEPRKWNMAPFNGDWTSSIFASIDPVAIASVAHDFLRTEYNTTDWPDEAYPNYDGIDDYLQQAADSTYWPDGFIYDPENDGTPLKSLGVQEHWNNPVNKQYTRNLSSGEGIELVKLLHDPTAVQSRSVVVGNFMLYQNYPNPFNPKTVIRYTVGAQNLVPLQHIELSIYSTLGQKVATLVNKKQPAGSYQVQWDATGFASGIYFYRLRTENDFIKIKKMCIIK